MQLIYAEKGNVYVYEQTYRSLRKDLLTVIEKKEEGQKGRLGGRKEQARLAKRA